MLLALLLALVVAAPGLFYAYGLAELPSFPIAPLQSPARPSRAWVEHGGAGLPYSVKGPPSRTMDVLNPWSYAYHEIRRCIHPARDSVDIHECVYYFKGYMAAYSAASYHVRTGNALVPQTWLEDELPVLALSIWITRHWTPAQVDAFLTESSRQIR